jgi:hypothetical protein
VSELGQYIVGGVHFDTPELALAAFFPGDDITFCGQCITYEDLRGLAGEPKNLDLDVDALTRAEHDRKANP